MSCHSKKDFATTLRRGYAVLLRPLASLHHRVHACSPVPAKSRMLSEQFLRRELDDSGGLCAYVSYRHKRASFLLQSS